MAGDKVESGLPLPKTAEVTSLLSLLFDPKQAEKVHRASRHLSKSAYLHRLGIGDFPVIGECALASPVDGLRSKSAMLIRGSLTLLQEHSAPLSHLINDVLKVAGGEFEYDALHSPEAIAAARNILQRWGEPVVEYAILGLESDVQRVRWASVRLLTDLGAKAERAIPALIKYARSDSDSSARAIAAIGKSATSVMLELSKSDDLLDRALAAKVFGLSGEMHTPIVIKRLNDLIVDKAPRVREEAISAVRSIGPKAHLTIPRLIEALAGSEDPYSAHHVVTSLQVMKEAALIPLTRALDHPNANVRRNSAYLLGGMGEKAAGALPRLRKMADEDPNSGAKSMADSAVRQIEFAVSRSPR